MREAKNNDRWRVYGKAVDALRACFGLVLVVLLAWPAAATHAADQAPGGAVVGNPSSDTMGAQQDRADHLQRAENAQAAHESEIHCLALNIYFEARGESDTGQRAVGHVVMNRAAHPRFPSSVCAVVRQGGEKRRHRCQFSWWCDGRSDHPSDQAAWQESLRLAEAIYAGELPDITGGAMWYHADYVSPYWSKILLKGDQIGQHIFYLEQQVTQNML